MRRDPSFLSVDFDKGKVGWTHPTENLFTAHHQRAHGWSSRSSWNKNNAAAGMQKEDIGC